MRAFVSRSLLTVVFYFVSVAVSNSDAQTTPKAQSEIGSAIENVGQIESESVLTKMAGTWNLSSETGSLGGESPEQLGEQFLSFAVKSGKLEISGNRIVAKHERLPSKTVTMTVDFSDTPFNALTKHKLSNGVPIMFTLENGKPFFASYQIFDDALILRYPAGCCSRSGNVLNFKRVKPISAIASEAAK
jgi:hypothetical protein